MKFELVKHSRVCEVSGVLTLLKDMSIIQRLELGGKRIIVTMSEEFWQQAKQDESLYLHLVQQIRSRI